MIFTRADILTNLRYLIISCQKEDLILSIVPSALSIASKSEETHNTRLLMRDLVIHLACFDVNSAINYAE